MQRLARSSAIDVRFINWPSDYGTRFLLEGLLAEQDIRGTLITGFFQLDFIPMVNERYF